MADTKISAMTAATAATASTVPVVQGGANRKVAMTGAGAAMIEAANAAAQAALLPAVVGDSGAGGTKGLVPAPAAGDAAAVKFLKADGTWAAPAGGGSALNFPAVYYVDTANGNDGTGAVGNPALPYATAQAAFDDWQAAGIAGRMHLMRTPTNAGGITVAANMTVPLHITGEGFGASKLGGLTASGSAGAGGDADLPGVSGNSGCTINSTSDWSVNLGAVVGNGGAGGAGGPAVSVDTSGGAGGGSSPTRLINAVVESVELRGGNGGNGQNYSGGDVGGNAGPLSTTILEGLRVIGAAGINMAVGVGGSGTTPGSDGLPGPLWAEGCLVDFSFDVIGSAGFVSSCRGTTVSVSGTVTDAGNNITAPTYPAF